MSVDPEDFIDQRVLILGRGTCMQRSETTACLAAQMHRRTYTHKKYSLLLLSLPTSLYIHIIVI